MAKPKVYVTRELPERGMKIIKERFDAEVWPEYGPPPKTEIIRKARDVDALVTLLSDKIDAKVFDAAPKLKIVAQMAVGFDNIDVAEATRRNIRDKYSWSLNRNHSGFCMGFVNGCRKACC